MSVLISHNDIYSTTDTRVCAVACACLQSRQGGRCLSLSSSSPSPPSSVCRELVSRSCTRPAYLQCDLGLHNAVMQEIIQSRSRMSVKRWYTATNDIPCIRKKALSNAFGVVASSKSQPAAHIVTARAPHLHRDALFSSKTSPSVLLHGESERGREEQSAMIVRRA